MGCEKGAPEISTPAASIRLTCHLPSASRRLAHGRPPVGECPERAPEGRESKGKTLFPPNPTCGEWCPELPGVRIEGQNLHHQSASRGHFLLPSARISTFLLRIRAVPALRLLRGVQYFVYVLLCSDGSYYVGHADAVETRVARHNDGRGADFTARRRPVTLAYAEPHPSIDAAIARERQIKRWSHDKKRALVTGDLARLKGVSCRTRRQAR